MDKRTLLREMRDGHAAIEAATAAASDTDLLAEAPGMPGWTRKDVLAHIAWWHDHSSLTIEGVRTGIDPWPDEDETTTADSLNARILAEHRGRTGADVRAWEAASFARLVGLVEAATREELFAEDPQPWFHGTVAETVAADSSGHYPEHLPHLA